MSNRKLKILMWADTFLPEIGGAEIIVNELILQYVSLGHEVLLFTVGNDSQKIEDVNGFRIYRLSKREMLDAIHHCKFGMLKKVRAEVEKLINYFQADLVHCHTSLWIYSLLFVWIFRGLINCPMLITIHLALKQGALDNKLAVVEELFSLATFITCVSHANKEVLAEKHPSISKKLLVVHNGWKKSFLTINALPEKPINILFVGRLVEQKGVDTLLRAFSLVLQDHQDVMLNIAGDGVERKNLEIIANQLMINQQVQFLGWIQPEAVLDLINESTLVVMPSRHEGFSIVALQVAQVGRPLIASRIESLMEMVVDRETGLLATCDDANSFAEAIKTLINNIEFATTLGLNAKKRAEKLFSIEKMTKNYLDILYKLARKQPDVTDAIGQCNYPRV